jgi:hypothetical protein
MADDLGIDLKSFILAGVQALAATETEVKLGQGLILAGQEFKYLTRTGIQTAAAILGAFPRLSDKLSLLAAPMNLQAAFGPAGFGTSGRVLDEFGEKRCQSVMFQKDLLGPGIEGQADGSHRAKVRTDFTEYTTARIYRNIQSLLVRDNGYGLAGANQGANVAFEAGLFAQM